MSSALTSAGSKTAETEKRRAGLFRRVYEGLFGPSQAERETERVRAVWGLDDKGRSVRPPVPSPLREKAKSGASVKAAQPGRSGADRLHLQVPFADKDRVKQLGARWDKEQRAWYVPPGIDTAGFAPWLTSQGKDGPAPVPAVMRESEGRKADVRQVLEVPFAERGEAKALGARWDQAARAWYVPAGVDLASFEAWLPGKQQSTDPARQFSDELRKAGLHVDQPEMDGRLHRVAVDGDRGREKSGAYVGHLDGWPAGSIWNFKTGGEKQPWKMKQGPNVKDRGGDRPSVEAQAEKRRQDDQAREQGYERVAGQARDIWANAAPASADHPYLTRKEVPSRGFRVGRRGQTITVADRSEGADKDATREMSVEGWLISPVGTAERGLTSLQFIPAREGMGKMFLPGGRIQGGYALIGDKEGDGPILLAEGRATGETLHTLSGLPVVVAYNAGNLSAVAKAVRTQYPDRAICIAGDNDHAKERETDARGQQKPNVGKVKALEAAEAAQGTVMLPPFKAHEKGSDWNDFARIAGQATASSAIRQHLVENGLGQSQRERSATVIPFEQQRQQARPPRSHSAERDGAREMER